MHVYILYSILYWGGFWLGLMNSFYPLPPPENNIFVKYYHFPVLLTNFSRLGNSISRSTSTLINTTTPSASCPPLS